MIETQRKGSNRGPFSYVYPKMSRLWRHLGSWPSDLQASTQS
ncbi:hypothetical protein COLINT_02670 [Collinsella intestinalis DSM 13280]|uniref:Uncharacterized protein n=1 Tax=Collinsella intestinalis DSM 13280 TaxID=521003 RepID=C4F9D6_9ACTN|nr:hypothetical protein COLINT_02670 [Collinsella intestinalis DSM 13280]